MRQRVTLQSGTVTGQDAFGEQQTEATTVGTYWAEVSMLSGREAVNAAQICAEATHKVRMRYVGPILPDQWFLFGGKRLNIKSVDNIDNRNREYLILCQEVVVPS